MAENALADEGFANPCCITLKHKYTELKERQAKLEQGRKALKQCLKILEPQLSRLQADNLQLNKACQDEKARADFEREQKENESAMRATLESQLDALKIECQMLQQNDTSFSQNLNGEVQRLEERILEGGKEIILLKELIEKEKQRADAEKRRADAERERAESEVKKANDAFKRVKEDKKLNELERKNYEANRVQLEELKTELSQAKLNLEETVRQLEIERLKADSELKGADSEMKKVDEALEKVKVDKRDVNDDSKSSEEYRVQLEVLKAEIVQVKSDFEESKKQLDIEKTRAAAEKKRADAEKRRAESVRKKAHEAEKKLKEDKRLADIERKNSEETRFQVDALLADISLLKNDLEETKKQLEKEKTRANTEKKKVDAEKNRSDSERKKANEAEKKIKECIRLADVERKRSEESKVQLEVLKTELIQVKSVLEETKKQLEKQKTRADAEKKRVESERKKGSEVVKKMKEDNRHADVEKRLSKEDISQLEVLKTGTVGVKETYEENKLQHNGSGKSKKRKKCGDNKQSDQQKSGNAYKQSTEEKHLLEQLHQEVDNNKHRIQEMQSLIGNLLSLKNLFTSPLSIQNSESESSKIKSLRKKLKFEKMLVKHAKEVAELEVARNNILQCELGRLKQEVLKFSELLDVLGNPAFKSDAGIPDRGKLCSLPLKRKHSHEQLHPTNLCSSQEITRPCSTGNASNSKCSIKCSAPFLPLHEGCSGETISCINSKLEPLHRGLNQRMLQSSAMNSCSASFSDRPSVGSQEDGVFHISMSTNLAEDNLNSEQFPTRLTDDLTTRLIHSHTSPIQKNSGDDNGNKESPFAPESIRNVCYGSQTTCQPHTFSDRSFSEKGALVPILQGKSSNEDNMSSKRRKKISEEHMAPEFALRTSSIESNLCKQASEPRPTSAVSFGTWKNGINDLLANPEISGSCNGLDLSDIMKLFDLDNEEDERSFCAAMERPLSPILPVLELQSHKKTDVCGFSDSLYNNFHVGRSTIPDDAAKCGNFNVIEVEIDPNKMSKSSVENCARQIEKSDGFIFPISKVDGFEKSDIQQIPDLRVCRNNESSPQMSDIVTIERESIGLCKTDVSLTCSSVPRYLIIHPDIKDAASISSICGAIKRYMSHCTMISSSNYIKESLVMLARDEGLSSMEKVCTFVTVMLQKINEDVMMNSGTSMRSGICQFIDTFSCNLNAVLSDIKMNMMDLWDLSDLLNVIEDFLTNRRALLYGDASSDMIKSASLDENGGILCGHEAPISLLVAGGALLATICASIDDVRFVCEVSCNILRTQKSDSSLVLIILHVFAHICGPKYFGEEHGLIVNVIRSLVVYLERLDYSDTISSDSSFLFGAPYNPWPCCNCPFLHDASSTDVVVSLLLKELHSYIIKSTGKLDHLGPINQAKSGAKMYEVDCLNYIQVTVCENFDIFSLLELVACFMSWNWSYENIVCPVLEMFESCAMECFSAAVITFLGQLGRIGVEAHGYDDAKVENLRNRISAFLTGSSVGNLEYLVQLASATALAGLIPFSFEELVDSTSAIPETALSLKIWFFSLTNEQQSSCKIAFLSCP